MQNKALLKLNRTNTDLPSLSGDLGRKRRWKRRAFSPNLKTNFALKETKAAQTDKSLVDTIKRVVSPQPTRRIRLQKALENVNTKVKRLAEVKVKEAKAWRFQPLKFLNKANEKFGYRPFSPTQKRSIPLYRTIKNGQSKSAENKYLLKPSVKRKDSGFEQSNDSDKETNWRTRFLKQDNISEESDEKDNNADSKAMLDKIFKLGLLKYQNRINPGEPNNLL